MVSFKEQWELCDEKCSTCQQVVKRQKGITRQNIRRLLTPKMNFTEWLITFILVMLFIVAWAYQHDIKQCTTWLNELKTNPKFVCDRCAAYMANGTQTFTNDTGILVPNITFTQPQT